MHLSGSITALATPFTVAGEIDFEAWRRLLDAPDRRRHPARVVVAGSTGEAATLSDDGICPADRRRPVAQIGGRMPVLAGTGQSDTAKTIAQTRLARRQRRRRWRWW